MKNYRSALLQKGAVLFLSFILLSACSKKDDVNTAPAEQTAKLALLISAPGADELSLQNNGKKVPTQTGLTYNTVNNYFSMVPGKGEFGFFLKKDSTSLLAKINYEVKAGAYYSLIFTGRSPQSAVILIEDDLSATATDKAKIRFANLSPDAPALDLYLQGKTDPAISHQSFKGVSAYLNVDPALKANFEVRASGSSAVLATLHTFKIEKGKIYTIWARGLLEDPTGAAFGLDAMTNK